MIYNEEFKELREHADVYAKSDRGEILRYHYRFGNLPYNKLTKLAEAGIIPRRLANVNGRKCAACMFGKMTKMAWQKKKKGHPIFLARKPEQCVSMDQM